MHCNKERSTRGVDCVALCGVTPGNRLGLDLRSCIAVVNQPPSSQTAVLRPTADNGRVCLP